MMPNDIPGPWPPSLLTGTELPLSPRAKAVPLLGREVSRGRRKSKPTCSLYSSEAGKVKGWRKARRVPFIKFPSPGRKHHK